MTRKDELTIERDSIHRSIGDMKETINIAEIRIKFLKKRLKLVEEEIDAMPEEKTPEQPKESE